MNTIVIPADVMRQVIECDAGTRTNLRVSVPWCDEDIEIVFERPA